MERLSAALALPAATLARAGGHRVALLSACFLLAQSLLGRRDPQVERAPARSDEASARFR